MFKKNIQFTCTECSKVYIWSFPEAGTKAIVSTCSCGKSNTITDFESYSIVQEIPKINELLKKYEILETNRANEPKKPLIDRKLMMKNWQLRKSRGVHVGLNSKTIYTPSTKKVALKPKLGNSRPLIIFTTKDIEDYNPKLLRQRECPTCGHKYTGSIVCPKRKQH